MATKYLVTLNEVALMAIMNTAVECYHGKVEAAGYLWGDITVRRGDDYRKLNVDLAVIEDLAERTDRSINPDLSTLERLVGFNRNFFPSLTFLGCFHTHPYFNDELQRVRDRVHHIESRNKAVMTRGDHVWLKDNSQTLIAAGYRLEVVITIVERLHNNDFRQPTWFRTESRSGLAFSSSDYHFWINCHAFRSIRSSRGGTILREIPEANVVLNVPYIKGGFRYTGAPPAA